ncbi:MAG: sodium:solute symporter family protein [Candidatus Cyclobacteriaceae bacterium M3_2C_046]
MAGRKLPLVLSSFALFALWFGSETIFGASSEFIQHGLLGVIEDPFGGALCLILYAVFLARKMYSLNLLTLGDLFRDSYGRTVELTAAFFMLITFFGYVAAQLVALGILFHIVAGIPLIYGILVSALVVSLYTMAGGMWAISVTDFWQSLVIIAGLVWVSFKLTEMGGGIENIISRAPAGFYRFIPVTFDPVNWIDYLAAWMVIGLGSLPSQDIFQRVNSARSVKTAIRSTYFGAFLYLLFAMFPLYIGLAARQLFPGMMNLDPQHILPEVVLQHTVLPVQVVFFGALISAIFSTCSGAILAPASILSENLVKPLIKKRLSESQFLRLLRGAVLLITGLSTLLALKRNNIFELVAQSSILGLVSLLIPMLAALFIKKANKTGAILSMIWGIIGWMIPEFFLTSSIPSLIWGLLSSGLGMVLGILLHWSDKKSPKFKNVF